MAMPLWGTMVVNAFEKGDRARLEADTRITRLVIGLGARGVQ